MPRITATDPPKGRVLICSGQPRPGTFTGLCLLCMATCTVTLEVYYDLTHWARTHTCDTVIIPGRSLLRCLYCGGTDDIEEIRVLVDDRTEEMALHCGACQGVWAQ